MNVHIFRDLYMSKSHISLFKTDINQEEKLIWVSSHILELLVTLVFYLIAMTFFCFWEMEVEP